MFKLQKKAKFNIMSLLVGVILFTSVFGVIIQQTFTGAENNNIIENGSSAVVILYGLIGLFVVIGFIIWLVKATGVQKL